VIPIRITTLLTSRFLYGATEIIFFWAAFSSALHVIDTLRANPTINFYQEEKKERASWWNVPLIDYETLLQESSAMKEVLASFGVEACKVTHN
jgi:hypothetical protein